MESAIHFYSENSFFLLGQIDPEQEPRVEYISMYKYIHIYNTVHTHI